MLAENGRWPILRRAALDWLVNETVREPMIDRIFADLCRRIVADGLPLTRATLHIRTLHPQFLGARLLWEPGMEEGAAMTLMDHAILSDVRYLNSPVQALFEGAEGLRRQLHRAPPTPADHALYRDLADAGITDYVAIPLLFAAGTRHATTWATNAPDGFDTEHLVYLSDLLPVLALVFELRLNRRIARTLLNTYVGEHAGERILAGEITRGNGATVSAAIWNCDIRGFTEISEQWPRDDVIAWLNEYFDVMVEPVERRGGEILKFIGDGMLAIFPLEEAGACTRALAAAREAAIGMRELNARRCAAGCFPIDYGIALHLGDVMYGNIGSRSRLDFTVIGPAVNVSARMQTLCKELKRQLLVSGPFANGCGCDMHELTALGRYPLRGVGEPLEVFAVHERR